MGIAPLTLVGALFALAGQQLLKAMSLLARETLGPQFLVARHFVMFLLVDLASPSTTLAC